MEKGRNLLWDQNRTMEERIQYVLENMTLEEKFRFLSTRHPALERLDVPAFSFGGEAAHGVEARNDQNSIGRPEETTCFSQPIGMSASWDEALIEKVGEVVGTEARALFHRGRAGGLSRWAPTVDLERDPRWGRTEEGYGEDPYLTGKMASAYIRGMQGRKGDHLRMAASVKHFYANNVEQGRVWKSSSIDPRNKQEYYLEPFRRTVEEGKAEGMMTAYNEINGVPAILNHEVADVVKGQWGLAGHVVCDGGDMTQTVEFHHYYQSHAETVAEALKAGVDCFTDNPEVVEAAVREAYEKHLIGEYEIDRAIANSFGTKIRLGLFDAPETNPYAGIGEADLNTAEAKALSRKMAQESAVLLKNEKDFLPLEKDGSLVLIGPVGDAWFQDWYGGEPPYRVSLKAGVEAYCGREILFENGLDRILLKAGNRYVGLDEQSRLVLVDDRRQAAELEVNDWGFGSTTFYVPAVAKYVSLYDNGILRADKTAAFGWFVKENFRMEKGKEEGQSGQGVDRCRLYGWNGCGIGVDEKSRLLLRTEAAEDAFLFEVILVKNGLEAACRAARTAEKVIMALGCNPVINSKEEIDRTDLILPLAQENMIQAVYGVNPNIALMLLTNYPYAINWEQEHIPAILQMSTGSQEMGNAAASLLFGETCPGGRLPMTWYRSVKDLPDMDDYDIIKGKRTYRYFDGEVLYPFGYGLSYTAFSYENLCIRQHEGMVHVSVTVKNVGSRCGDEVVQLYARRISASRILHPRSVLVGFRRVKDFMPQESRQVELEISCRDLAIYDVIGRRRMVEEGDYLFYTGGSAVGGCVSHRIWIAGESTGLRDPGQRTAADHYDDYENIVLHHAGGGNTCAAVLDSAREGILEYRDFVWKGEENGLVVNLRSKVGGSIHVKASFGGAGETHELTRWQGQESEFAEIFLPFGEIPVINDRSEDGEGDSLTLWLELEGNVEISDFFFAVKAEENEFSEKKN